MTDEQNSKCHKIIHTAAATVSGIGFGFAQIPGSDAIPITGIQVAMIISLGGVFGRDVSEAAAKSILGGAVAAIGGRTVSQFLVGWLPGIGNAINATTAFTITEALGWYVANDFSDEAEKQAEAERLARKEAERKAKAESEATKSQAQVQNPSEKQVQPKAEKLEKQPEQITLQKQVSIPTRSQSLLCAVFSCILAVACMLIDTVLERFTLHFKIWGAVSGIFLAGIFNVIIYAICNNKGWHDKIRPMMSYSNFLAMVINLFCALVISPQTWDNVHGWDEAIAEFFRTPLLNWGLLVAAVFWWFEVDRKIKIDWSL